MGDGNDSVCDVLVIHFAPAYLNCIEFWGGFVYCRYPLEPYPQTSTAGVFSTIPNF